MQKINRSVDVTLLDGSHLFGVIKDTDFGGLIVNVTEDQAVGQEVPGPAYAPGLRYIPFLQTKLVRYTEIFASDEIQETSSEANLKFLGAWDSQVSYVIGQVVTFSGTAYVCTADNLDNTPPNVAFWESFASSIGNFHMANAQFLAGRNVADNANLNLIGLDASDHRIIPGRVDIYGDMNLSINASIGGRATVVDYLTCASGIFGDRVATPTRFFGTDFMDTDTADWPVATAAGSAQVDSLNDSLKNTCPFSAGADSGVGGMLEVPVGLNYIRLKIRGRSENAPRAPAQVMLSLYLREIPDNGAVSAWGAEIPLTAIDIPTNQYWQTDEQTFLYADLGFTGGGQMLQFELIRKGSDPGDTLTETWNLLDLTFTFLRI